MAEPSHNEPTKPEKSFCPCRPHARWLPILLLVFAAASYGYSLYAGRYARVAKAVRVQAGRPFSQVSVVYRLEDRPTGFIRILDPDTATELMQAMAKARPMRPFRESAAMEGDLCDIMVTYTNGTRATFMAVRLYGDPETLYVGTMLPGTVAVPDAPPRFELSPPARVEGAGTLVGRVIGEMKTLGENLPANEDLIERVKQKHQ